MIPSSVTSIGECCFAQCERLTAITIPSSVKSLSDKCFYFCESLTSITIPSSVTHIGALCFGRCKSLTSIVIPSSVTSLGNQCLTGCASLTSITLPSSVTSIGSSCFDECSVLESVNCYAETPPSIASGSSLGVFSALLYVPAASVESYKLATGWKDFVAILAIPGTETEEPEMKKCEAPCITFSDGKLHFESSTPNAVYHYTLTCNDVESEAYSESGDVELEAAYNITAYATAAEDYAPSDKATAILYWMEQGTGTETSIFNAAKRGIVVSSHDGFITLSGLENGEKVSFYSSTGELLGTSTANNGVATASFATGQIVIAQIGTESIKVSL